jgi:hypothetical protein
MEDPKEVVEDIGVQTVSGFLTNSIVTGDKYNLGDIYNFFPKSPMNHRSMMVEKREGVWVADVVVGQDIKSKGAVQSGVGEMLDSDVLDCVKDGCTPRAPNEFRTEIPLENLRQFFGEEIDSGRVRDAIVEDINDDVMMKQSSLILTGFTIDNTRFEGFGRSRESGVLVLEYSAEFRFSEDPYLRGVAEMMGKMRDASKEDDPSDVARTLNEDSPF